MNITFDNQNIDSLYYVYPDRLGSYTHITNSSKQVVRALHFDPWGNVKSDADWSVFDNTSLASPLAGTFRFDRGFTGHEHYAELKIINMNGRLYDPVIARFFSPDNFVQAPEFTQSYNRYSYCLNNPLQYVDPSGESFTSLLLYSLCNILTIPARVTTEGVSFINDHINGNVKSDGYFHSDYLFGSAAPHYINYNKCVNLENAFANSIHEPDMMTDADGTSYRTEYYWAAVGVGGEYHLSFANQNFSGVFGRYKETVRWYKREVPVETDFSHTSASKASLYSDVVMSLNGFAMANGFKTNLMDATVRYNYKSARSWIEFRKLRDTQKAFRYNQTLGKTGVMYLKGSKCMGGITSGVSASLEITNYVLYTSHNGFDWRVSTKVGMDVAMTALGVFGGPLGFAISTSYFILDVSTDSFGGFGKMY